MKSSFNSSTRVPWIISYFSQRFKDCLTFAKSNRFLFFELLRREIDQGYNTTLLGKWWYIISSMVSLTAYTILFKFVFKLRWSDSINNSILDYSLALYVGLIFFTFFIEIANRSTTLFASNLNYVKKVHFPLSLLPLVITARSFYNLFTCILVLLPFKIFMKPGLSLVNLELLIYIPIIVLFGIGISLLISSLSVYLPDIQYIVSSGTSLLIFVTPVFYSIELVPRSLLPLYNINPLSLYLTEIRNILIFNVHLHIHTFIVSTLMSVFVFLFGIIVFDSLRKGFSDAF